MEERVLLEVPLFIIYRAQEQENKKVYTRTTNSVKLVLIVLEAVVAVTSSRSQMSA